MRQEIEKLNKGDRAPFKGYLLSKRVFSLLYEYSRKYLALEEVKDKHKDIFKEED